LKWAKENKRKLIPIAIVLLLLVLIALPILSYFQLWNFKVIYDVTKEVANFLYLISGFLLVLGLYLTFRQIDILKVQVKDQIKGTEQQITFIKEDMKIRNHRAAVEKSIDYLHLFANDIFPRIEKYIATIGEYNELDIKDWNPSKTDYYLDILAINPNNSTFVLMELDRRRSAGLLEILNNIEFISAGIIHGLGKEDVVYDPIATSYINFISKEIVEISSQRHLGNPFENTIGLYKLWKNRKKSVDDALQIEELTSIIESKKAELEAAASLSKSIEHIGKVD